VRVLLFRTRFGYDLRAAGLQPDAAEAGGIKVNRVWIWAMALAGALAGLGGTNFVLGYKGYYETGSRAARASWASRWRSSGATIRSACCSPRCSSRTLSQGGLAIHAAVPKQLVEVLQATVILGHGGDRSRSAAIDSGRGAPRRGSDRRSA
jgi:simple sugar transport system permease protein